MAKKFCDVILQAYAHKSSTNDVVKEIWKSKGLLPPVIINIGYKGKGIPGSGTFAKTVSQYRSSHGGKFVAPFIRGKAKYVIPKGYDVGRIALVGFSAGCGAVKEILKNPEDSKLIDFVYFCDGLHSQWDSLGCSLDPSQRLAQLYSDGGCSGGLNIDAIGSVVEFAQRAAVGIGPAMVVTSSQITPEYPSTAETAYALEQAVFDSVGGEPTQSGLIPNAFLGFDGDIPKPPKSDEQGGYWPGKWNPGGCPVRSVKIRNWNVVHSYTKGWLTCATFATKGDGDKCDHATNSQPAHIFQQEYVLPEVYRHILSERWEVECVEPAAISGLCAVDTSYERQFVSEVTKPKMDRYGGVIKRNPRLLQPVSVSLGLGQDPVSCFQEGVFSNILSAEDIEQERMGLAVGAAAAGLGAYLLWNLWSK